MFTQESLFKFISHAYGYFDQLHISVTELVVIAVFLALALLFAVREAAAWFFRIHELKQEIRSLRDQSVYLEGEIHALQTLVRQLTNLSDSERKPKLPPIESQPAATAVSFPIIH
jgi:hypothetical protein